MQSEGQIAESVALLQDLIEAGDRRGEVLYRYGRGLAALGEIGRAVWSLDAAIGDPEWILPAARELAFISNQSKNHELALQTLERLREERTDGAGDEDYISMMLEARAYLGTRRHYEEALEPLEAILENDPENQEALRLKVVALLGLKQTDEAYEIIRQAGRESEGTDADADTGEEEAYWCSIESSFQRDAGDIEKAEEILEECLERFPTSIALLDEGIKVYSAQGKADEAAAILRAAYETEPENRAIRFPFVLQLSAMGRMQEAETVLRSVLERELEKEEPNPIEVATAWVDLAGLLVDQEKLEEGLDAYAEAVSLLGDTVSPELLFSQAELMIRVGRYDDALKIAEQTPIEVHGPMLRGRVAFERGELEKAYEELSQAALLWPNNASLRYYMARASEGLGEFDRAVEDYRQALRSDRDLDAARLRLGKLHLAEGRAMHAQAIMMIAHAAETSALSLDLKLVEIEIQARTSGKVGMNNIPRDPRRSDEEIHSLAVRALSRGLRARDGPETAAEILNELQEPLEGTFARLLFREQIENLLEAGKDEEALALARAAVADRPQDVYAQTALARVLSRSESKSEAARELLASAVSDRPGDAELLAWLGEVEVQLGQTASAIEHFEAALSISPENHDAMLGLSRALVALGRQPEAISRLELFLARDNPIDGKAALELAKLVEGGEGTEERRIALGKRALRFGAGERAVEFLRNIDPELVPIAETSS